MKILLLNDRYPPRYKSSVANITKGLSEFYREQGNEVTVITSHRLDASEQIIREKNVVSLPIDYRTSLRHYKSLRQSKVSKLLDKEIARVAPDVVHAHNLHMYLTYDALRIARQHTSKVFVTMHDAMSGH